MKMLLQSLPLALLAALAVLPFTVGTQAEAQVVDSSAVAENLCGRCGDGQCAKTCGETATSCPKDCGGVPSEF
jgi:hypothetical protein